MRLQSIKLPNLIMNDDLKCIVTINTKEINIDGQAERIISQKEYNCTFSAANKISYTMDNIDTICKGIVKINGKIVDEEESYYGGEVVIFGNSHNIISIQEYRNLLNPSIIDYTELYIE